MTMTRHGWGEALAELGRAVDPAGAAEDRAGAADTVLLERFVRDRDEAAFAALVDRHGPMVFRTARGVVGSLDDADDVFQATFLTLARRASAVRSGASLAPWLHRVAHRAALRALGRRRSVRPGSVMGSVTDPDHHPAPPEPDPARTEAGRLLHAEIDRLPAGFREAVVLCDLEGLARDEVADRLGWPAGTVASRLSRGRRLLRDRLTRRLGGAEAWLGDGPGAQSIPWPGPIALPPGLVARVVGLAAEVPRITHVGRFAAVVIAAVRDARPLLPRSALALAVVTLGAVAAARSGRPGVAIPLSPLIARAPLASAPASRPVPASQTAIPIPEAPRPALLAVRGRVVDPTGRAVGRAEVDRVDTRGPTRPVARTDAAGTFGFEAPAPRPGDPGPTLLAVAPGFGPGLARVEAGQGDAVEVRLTPLAPLIRGRSEGPPGVRFRPMALLTPKGEGPDPARAIEALGRLRTTPPGLEAQALADEFAPVVVGPSPPGITIDPAGPGAFAVAGLGSGWLLLGTVEGAGLAPRVVLLAPGLGDEPARDEIGPSLRIVSGDFTHRASPAQPRLGVVRDDATGQPILGAEVVVADAYARLGLGPPTRLQSDAEGRFTLDGPVEEVEVEVRPASDASYLGIARRIAAGAWGDGPAEFRLRPGVWATGRVVDRASARPRRARVEAFARLDDPTAQPARAGDRLLSAETLTDDGGQFRLPIARGRAILAATTSNPRDAIGLGLDAPGVTDLPRAEGGALATRAGSLDPRRFNALVAVGPSLDGSGVATTITVTPGSTLRGTVVGPDGTPLRSGVVAWNLARDAAPVALAGGQFEVVGLVPGQARRVDFRHDAAGLVGSLEVRAAANGPVEVRLQPWASYELGVGDGDGHPIAGRFRVVVRDSGADPLLDEGRSAAPPILDRALPDGRRELGGFDPGLVYDILFRTPGLGDIPIMENLRLDAGRRESRGFYAVRADGISAL